MDFISQFFTPEKIIRIPTILIALTIHECAHGWVALKLGDRTAYNAGRITLNPIPHLDPIGALLLLFAPFGWAKPVPIDLRNFQNPKQGMLLSSLAGPVSNIILALIIGYTLRIMGFSTLPQPEAINSYFILFLVFLVIINTGIAFFNMIPVPPLDGSHVLLGMLPDRHYPKYFKISRPLPKILLSLIIIEWISTILGFHIPIFSMIIYPLFTPFYSLIHLIIFWRLP